MDTADKGPVSNVSHYIHVYMILGFNYGHNEYRLFKIVHVLVTTKTRTSLRIKKLMKYIFTSTNWFTKGLTCMVKDRHSVCQKLYDNKRIS